MSESSARYSLTHAHRRIDELERELIAFVNADPYEFRGEVDAERRYKRYWLRLRQPIPVATAGIIGDASNGMRAALDQTCFAIARGAGRSGGLAKFPFGPTREEAAKCAWHKSKDLPQEIFDTILSFEPYEGGHTLLWGLNNLCNTYKHEIVVPTMMLLHHAVARWRKYPGIEPAPWPPVWDRTQQQMEVARAPVNSERKVHLDGAMSVCIADVRGVPLGSVVPILRAMHADVTRCIDTIEQTAIRFGFLRP